MATLRPGGRRRPRRRRPRGVPRGLLVIVLVGSSAALAAGAVGSTSPEPTLIVSGAPFERPRMLVEGKQAALLLDMLAAAPLASKGQVSRLAGRRELELAVIDTPQSSSPHVRHPDDGRAFGLLYPRTGTAPSLVVVPGADRRPRIVRPELERVLLTHGLDMTQPVRRCPATVTREKGSFNVGSARVRVALYWRRGVLTAGPLADGGVYATVMAGGAIYAKLGWWRARGQLAVSGRRLDRRAPPLRASVSNGYGSQGFQPSGLEFPTPGCWRVTGRAGGAATSFVVWVARTG